MSAFRNYSIPGAGGPSPMVAAFWDDLMTTNGGDVYYYSTDEYVIIEWDDMSIYGESSNQRNTIIAPMAAQNATEQWRWKPISSLGIERSRGT